MANTLEFTARMEDEASARLRALNGEVARVSGTAGASAAQFHKMDGGMRGIGIGAVAAGAAIGIGLSSLGSDVLNFGKQAIFTFANLGSEIYDMSQRTGLSAESLTELKFAAEQSGSSLEGMEVGLRKLGIALTNAADGSQEAIDKFTNIGLAVTDFAGKSVSDSLDLVLGKLAEMPAGFERSSAAVELFGKTGTSILPMLADGTAGLAEMRAKAHELGVVLSDEAAAKADLLGDKLDEAKTRVRGLSLEIGAKLTPYLIAAVNGFQQLTTWLENNRGAMTALAAIIGGAVVTAIVALVAAIGWIPIAVGAAVAGAAIGLTYLANHFDDVRDWIITTWQKIKAPFAAVFKWIAEKWAQLWDLEAIQPLKGFLSQIGSWANQVSGVVGKMVNWIIDQLNKIKLPDWMTSDAAVIGLKVVGAGPLAALAEAARGGFDIPHVEAWGGIVAGSIAETKSKIGDFFDGVGDAFGGIGDKFKSLMPDLSNLGGKLDLSREGFDAAGDSAVKAGEAARGAMDETAKAAEEAAEEAARIAAKAAEEAARIAEEARERLRDALSSIEDQFRDDQIKAYYEGGEAQLAAVKATQESMRARIVEVAAELQQRWGLDLPTALTKAMGLVTESVNKVTEASAKLRESLFESAKAFLNVKILPGAQAGMQQFFGGGATFGAGGEFGFLGGNVDVSNVGVPAPASDITAPASQYGSLAELSQMTGLPMFYSGGMVPGDFGAPSLIIAHGGEQVGPAGQSAPQINITINAGVASDPLAIANEVVSLINEGVRNGGLQIDASAIAA